jgi:hypothetical protein
MNQSQTMTLPNPLVRVSITWLWIVVPSIFLRVCPTIADRLFRPPYFSSYFEILLAGLIPVLFTILGREKWSQYGLTARGLTKSLVWSLVFVAVAYSYSKLSTGHWISFGTLVSDLSLPAKVSYAFLGIFAYGPLEMFFFIWLVCNTEQIFHGGSGGFLLSLSISAILCGLLHFMFQGFFALLDISVTFFVLGLIFRWTKSSIGPMIAWTLLNAQAWFLASLLWS